MQIQPVRLCHSNTNFGMAEKAPVVSEKTMAYINEYGVKAAIADLKATKFDLTMKLLPYTSDAMKKNIHAMKLALELAITNNDLDILEPKKENRFIADV